MKKLNIYLSGHVRTLYKCFPETLKVIKGSNPDIDISVYYSFWKSTERLLDRKKVTGHPDSFWASRSTLDLTEDMVQEKNLNLFFSSQLIAVQEHQMLDASLMESVLAKTPFKNENKNNVSKLSSQYFQILEAANLHKGIPENDFCLRLRSDITIGSFPRLEDVKEALFVNEYIWEGEKYSGKAVNEMIWLCKGKYFHDTCSLYRDEESFVKYRYGENVMGHYFLKLIKENKINNITSFNFDYRIIR